MYFPSVLNYNKAHFPKSFAMKQIALAALVSAALMAAAAAPREAAAQAAGKKPNVIFLFTDDQRADTIGALGNPHIQTPRLDALARRGFVFRNAYCLGGNVSAVCLPSRNMLLSGRAYFRWQGNQA